MYQTFLDAQRKGDLEEEKDKLKKITPEPMNTMLTKQPRDEATKKRKDRRAMVVEDVPPTSTGLKNKYTVYCTHLVIIKQTFIIITHM